MQKRWVVKKKKADDIIAHILANRGITGKKEQEQFLSPAYDRDLGDPFLMKGMKKAVARIKKALAARERIGIFGDYDVDGVCGSVVLHEFFEKVGVTPFFETYLPDRAKDGYGLNRHGLEHFKKQGVTLLITVDCGITDHAEITWAKENGIDVIVTDHHEVSQGLPPALAVVDPKQQGEKYPFSGLAGTGVAFKLMQALRKSVNHDRISEAWEKWLLDLVAFATVSDQMPLTHENRTLVRYGLMVMAKTRRLGLRELIYISRLNPSTLTTEDLLYQLAPRVNAASRIDHALKAFKLLTTADPIEAHALAREIDRANKERQRIVAKALAELQERIAKNLPNIQKEHLIFEGSENISPGICGLIANKIIDHYGYPTFVYSKGQEVVKGSVRSLPPFSVVQAMRGAKDILIDWGGHHQAGGFSLVPKNLTKFKKELVKSTKSLAPNTLVPTLEIDRELGASDITIDLWDRIQLLQPFGKNNPEPLFLLKKAEVYAARKIGSGQAHFRLTLKKDEQFFEAIYFRGVVNNSDLQKGHLVDVVFALKRSDWGVSTRAELNIVDLHHAD